VGSLTQKKKLKLSLQCLSMHWSLNVCKAEDLPHIVQNEEHVNKMIGDPSPPLSL